MKETTATQTAGQEKTAQGSRGPRWALAAVLVLAFGGFYALGWQRYFTWEYLHDHLDFLHEQVQENFVMVLLVYAAVYVAVTALSLPVAAILSLLAGWLFGRWLGTGVVGLASTLGATLAFLSSRFLFRAIIERRFGSRLQTLNQGVDKNGAYYLFTLRLVPVFPFFLVNLGMGLTRMGVCKFAWVSWLGMVPGTFLYVNAGQALGTLAAPGDILSPSVLISFALVGMAPLALRWLSHGRARPGNLALVVLVLDLFAKN